MTNERDYIPVGMSGKHGVWNNALFFCEPGTYYLKEMNTPKGYQVHSEAFGPYTVKDGQGLTIKIPNTPRYAKAGIIKKDVATAKALAGAKYGLYSSKEDARNEEEPIGVFTTGADGKSNLLEVLAHKTYYVREISAPRGYKTDANIYALNVADSVTATVWTELTDEPDVGKIRVKKASSDPAAVTDTENSLYSLEGAVYTLYNENGESAGTLKTGKDGTSAFLTVQCGTYTLRETEPSPGFALDKETHNVTVTGGSEITVDSTEPVLKGKITVKKVSSEEKEEKAPDTLPITGAVYSLYNSEEDAAEGRADVVNEKSPSAVLEYANLVKKLAPIGKLGDFQAADEISGDEAIRVANELLEALDDFDDDRSKELVIKLSGYPFRTTQKEILKTARGYIEDFLYDEAADAVKEVIPAIE